MPDLFTGDNSFIGTGEFGPCSNSIDLGDVISFTLELEKSPRRPILNPLPTSVDAMLPLSGPDSATLLSLLICAGPELDDCIFLRKALRPALLAELPLHRVVAVPKTTGQAQTRAWRMVGMQAHMMATLISTADQRCTSKLSWVRLLDVEKLTRARRRRMLTTVTLARRREFCQRLSKPQRERGGGGLTYKVPTTNMRPTASFFFQCRRSDWIWDSGRASIQKSRAIDMAALAQPTALMLMQWP